MPALARAKYWAPLQGPQENRAGEDWRHRSPSDRRQRDVNCGRPIANCCQRPLGNLKRTEKQYKALQEGCLVEQWSLTAHPQKAHGARFSGGAVEPGGGDYNQS